MRWRGGRLSGGRADGEGSEPPPERTLRCLKHPPPTAPGSPPPPALLGASAVAALVLGAGPAPSVLQLAGASDDDADDISGNCDEAEHADDPECAGTPTAGATTTTSTGTHHARTVDDGTRPRTARRPPRRRGIRSLDAAGAGTVIYAVEGGSLRLVSRHARPAAGAVEVEQAAGREIELDFRSGTQRVQVNVEIEDGQVRERVRVRDDADDTDIRTEDGVVRTTTTAAAPAAATTTAVDDDSGDDDVGRRRPQRLRPRRRRTVGDDDDSGSGHGSDD